MPPRLARLLAAVVAIALIGGALWFKTRGSSSDGGPSSPGDRSALGIVCVTELAEVCQALAGDGVETKVEDAAVTAAALKAAQPSKPPFDGWVTLAPWPEMVDVARGPDVTALFPSGSVSSAASSPITTVAVPDAAACAETWACLAEKAGPDQRVGMPGSGTALQPIMQGSAAAGLLGTADFGNDRFSEVTSQIQALEGSAPTQPRPATRVQLTVIATQSGSYSVVATVGAFATSAVTSQAGTQRELRQVNPQGSGRVDVVMAPLVGGDRGDRVNDLLTGQTGKDALKAQGWTVPATKGATGLPAADVLVALQEEIG